ncbi:MAG: acetyl-CoA C-acetyltransferase [Candidatus Brocadiia bacterium]
MKEVIIASAVRTPIGKFQGSLMPFSAPDLGGFVISEAVKRAGIKPEQVEEVIMGNVISAGLGQNPARQALRKGGIPDSVGAFTINKVCGSGLKTIMLGANAILAGEYNIIVAGGMENMTNAPYILPTARYGQRLGHGKMIDAMVFDGLWDIYNDFHMGHTAELVADKYGITRQMQDEFAMKSNLKAAKAIKEGKFKPEIIPVKIKQPKKPEPIIFDTDEGVRGDTTMESLGKLKPAFKENGTVTAGNASQISDGASAVVIMNSQTAIKNNVIPLAKITGYATGGMAPEWVMMAPLEAIKRLLYKTGMKTSDFDLFEINEAFSSAAVALTKELNLPTDKVNVNGGAVALGHPIGCSGARLLTTIIYALKDQGMKKGLVALCLGGGNAVAMSVELW